MVLRRDSVLGVPGNFYVYRAGRLSIVNAPGAGFADDTSFDTYITSATCSSTWPSWW
jgi:uncharacterized circularly permuted ATP-grasp superfamily protein